MGMPHLSVRFIGWLYLLILVLAIAIPTVSASPSKSQGVDTPLSFSELASKIENKPIWIEGQSLSQKAREFISFLSGVEADGLEPKRYQRDAILAISNKNNLDETELLQAEFLLNQAFLTLSQDLIQGQTDWKSNDPKWHIPRNPLKLDDLVHILNSGAPINDALNNLSPNHTFYKSLKSALRKYQGFVHAGGWNPIETTVTLKLDMKSPDIEKLRQRLAFVGDLENTDPKDPQLFDEQLLNAVKRFQARHGLQQDGVVGRNTRAALNLSAEERVQQIKINMERWRWLPRELGDTYIMVNTAAFTLDYFWNDEALLSMRVIVGDDKNRTPVFTEKISYIEINPVWNVPRKIVLEEILPKLVTKPDYLEKNGFKILSDWSSNPKELTLEETGWSKERIEDFPYRLQQVPGDGNALGRIKFIFPNQFSIYMHDTPGKALFKKAPRNFSHGCIRVEKPKELALALFIEQLDQWDDKRLNEVLATEETNRVVLEKSLPVYIVYFTSWADDAGTVHFSKDHYHRDISLTKTLFSE
jgi:murein L,D-transpeptidase YcbB/YkuD